MVLRAFVRWELGPVGLPALAFAAVLGSAAAGQTPAAPSAPAPASCSAQVNGLNFVCGVVNPEDLVALPGERWLIASGYNPGGGLPAGSGLALIDAPARAAAPLYSAAPAQIQPDRAAFPRCPGPPPAHLETHGLYLAPGAQVGRHMLYAVSHVPREAVEVFEVRIDGAADRPQLAWTGCIPIEGFRGNSVAALPDGTLLVTVLNAPGRAAPDGTSRGVVLQRRPGEPGFSPRAGSETPGANGIEVSRDGREFYVAGFGDATIYVFSAGEAGPPLRSVKAPGFVPDNLRWSGDRLVGVGPMYDEPACGGSRREAAAALGEAARKPGGGCNRGYMAAALDPQAMSWKILAYAEPNPQIGIISAGVIVGDTLWIGAALSPGLAWRLLPGPPRR